MLEVSRRQHFVTNKQRGLLWQLRSLQRLHPAASLAFKVPAAGSHLAVPRMGQAVSQSADELISGRKPTPATRQAQPSISNPTHLIVLANGLHGTPANWTTILVQLNRHLDSSQVLIHPSDVNRRTDTFDGIDVCGRRLAEEIQGVVKAHPSLQRLSVVGHSMGGLLLRYALGVSFNPDKQTVAGLEPCHFITLATPHLGCDAEGVSQVPFIGWIGALQPLQTLLSAVSIPTAAALFKRTGRQFFMADEDTGQLPGDAGLPLLARMTRDVPQRKEYFFSALCSFASRTAYANTGGDHLVGWANSSLRFMHQLPRLPETAASAKGVVLEDKLLAAFDVRFKQQAEPQRATSRSDLPVSDQQPALSAPDPSTTPQQQEQQEGQTEAANLLSHPLTPTSASAAAPLAAAPHSSSPSSCLSTATTLTTSPTRVQPLTSSRGTQPAALFPSTAASQPDAGQQAAPSPQVAQASVKQPNQGEAGAPGLGQRGRMVEEMLQQLQSLAWRRIDVSFRGAVMPFAHNHIQVTRRWLNFEGESVALHLAQQLAALDQAYLALKASDRGLQGLEKRSSLEGAQANYL
ncbi:putative serine esterase-domain-containing protein [Haematococcus lacustris]